MSILKKVVELERELQSLKSTQFLGSSSTPAPYSYEVSSSQSVPASYGMGTIVIKFTSDEQVAPIIGFVGNMTVNGIATYASYDPRRSNGQPYVTIDYDLGKGAIRYAEIKGGGVQIGEKVAFVTLDWASVGSGTGSAIMSGRVLTSSAGKVEVVSATYL